MAAGGCAQEPPPLLAAAAARAARPVAATPRRAAPAASPPPPEPGYRRFAVRPLWDLSRPGGRCRGRRGAAPTGHTRRPRRFDARRARASGHRAGTGAALDLSFGCSRGLREPFFKLLVLAVLQLRLVPRAWAVVSRYYLRLCAKWAQIASPEELLLVQQALSSSSKLGQDVELASSLLRKGSQILASKEELAAANPPVRLRYRPPGKRRRDSDDAMVPRRARAWEFFASACRSAEGPLILYAWGLQAIQASAYVTGRLLTRSAKPRGAAQGAVPTQALCGKLSLMLAFTSLALFAHGFVSAWRDRRSRGRAEVTDVLGSQSSLREAQVNALKVALQVLVWAVYIVGVLWAAGIQVGRVLLVPSITAVVLGWVGREIVANIISGVVLHLTQPFAQGDWVTLEGGNIDGWVQDVGNFYTKVVQWDKRPMYVPNFKLMSMSVQNNSRMTNRRVLFELPLRMRDIPKIPQIVQEMQEMINSHEDIDSVQHRLVRWRSIGQYSAEIWVSCYTKPTMEGIRLATWTATLQSVLERCSAIVYRNGAEFASVNDRYTNPGGGDSESSDDPKSLGQIITDQLYSTFNSARESQLRSREQVLWERERNVKQMERDVEAATGRQVEREQEIAKAAEKYRKLLQQEVEKRESARKADENAAAAAVAAAAAAAKVAAGAAKSSSTKVVPASDTAWSDPEPKLAAGGEAAEVAEAAASAAVPAPEAREEAAAPELDPAEAESFRGLEEAMAEADRQLRQEGTEAGSADQAAADAAAASATAHGTDGGEEADAAHAAGDRLDQEAAASTSEAAGPQGGDMAAEEAAPEQAEEAEICELKMATPDEIEKEAAELAAAESQVVEDKPKEPKPKGRIPVKEMGD